MKKHFICVAAICLLLASCAQKPGEGKFSEEQSRAADSTVTITENNIPEESEGSDSTAESSISLSDESENDDNSEDEISRQQELVVKKLVSRVNRSSTPVPRKKYWADINYSNDFQFFTLT